MHGGKIRLNACGLTCAAALLEVEVTRLAAVALLAVHAGLAAALAALVTVE